MGRLKGIAFRLGLLESRTQEKSSPLGDRVSPCGELALGGFWGGVETPSKIAKLPD